LTQGGTITCGFLPKWKKVACAGYYTAAAWNFYRRNLVNCPDGRDPPLTASCVASTGFLGRVQPYERGACVVTSLHLAFTAYAMGYERKTVTDRRYISRLVSFRIPLMQSLPELPKPTKPQCTTVLSIFSSKVLGYRDLQDNTSESFPVMTAYRNPGYHAIVARDQTSKKPAMTEGTSLRLMANTLRIIQVEIGYMGQC
jgi:hypothetical protein